MTHDHAHTVVAPYFRDRLAVEFGAHVCRVEVDEVGEQMRVHYPTALGSPEEYVGNSVLLEFGGRNIAEPSEEHVVRPDIAEHLDTLDFPFSKVNVLSSARTFWEKATLMHVECQRGEFRTNAKRLSRHWYDMAMLSEHSIGRAALADRGLLADVVRHKKVFYNASYANRIPPASAAECGCCLMMQRLRPCAKTLCAWSGLGCSLGRHQS